MIDPSPFIAFGFIGLVIWGMVKLKGHMERCEEEDEIREYARNEMRRRREGQNRRNR